MHYFLGVRSILGANGITLRIAAGVNPWKMKGGNEESEANVVTLCSKRA